VTPSTKPRPGAELCLALGTVVLAIIRRGTFPDGHEIFLMKSRLKAFGLHFSGSASVLLLVLGTLYLGWYRWPGWYLTGVLNVLPIMVGVDVVLGPLLTLVIASPGKPARVLARDIACIVVVQLIALCYGATTLWHGRPLYYTYSGKELSVTQGIDLQPAEVASARQSNPEFAPHWYSRPRWAWAPLPQDQKSANTIIDSATHGGFDVTAMPRYFKPWTQGLGDLRQHLRKVGDLNYFSGKQRDVLAKRLKNDGFDPAVADTLPMTGHGVPLLAVFDLQTLQIKALLRAN
jgi:hypothetical protein